jgi:hypothetical protein
MNKVFNLTNEKSWKTVYVTGDKLYLINKSYNTPEEFMKGFEDTGLARLLKSKKEIDVLSITGLQHAEKTPKDLTILYVTTKETLEFDKQADMEEVAAFLAGEKKFTSSAQQLSTFKAIQSPLLGLLITVLAGWILYGEAKTLEEGGTIEITGRRAGSKRLFAWLAETLGTNGVLLVSALAVLACGYFIYKNLKTPPNQVSYQ